LELLRKSSIRLNLGDKMLELLSTHPNMLKRIKKLSEYRA
jgi:Zn-dependent protease with chaperone function